MNLKKLFKVLNYDSISFPFLNFFIFYEDDDLIKSFLKSLKYKWVLDEKNSLIEINKVLNETSKNINKNKSLRTIALFTKAHIYNTFNEDEQMMDMYNEIRQNFCLLPRYLRPFINMGMKIFYSILNTYEVKELRSWSKEYENRSSSKAFKLFAEARKQVNLKNYKKAISLYIKGSEEGKKYPHPTAILIGLDLACQYSLNISNERIFDLSEDLEFYSSFYYENISIIFDNLFTIFEVYKKYNNLNIHKISSLILRNKDKIKSSDYFDKKIYNIQKLYFSKEKKSYKTTKHLSSFLNKFLKINGSFPKNTLKRIINQEVSFIKSYTLKRIIKSYDIKFKTSNPNCINCELIKIDIEDKFSIYSLKKYNLVDLWNNILFTYMSLDEKFFNISDIYKMRDNYSNLINFFSSNYIFMDFFIAVFEPIPFFKARKDLIKLTFNELNIDNFYYLYLNISNTERSLMDGFIRNYSRYKNIKFHFNLIDLFNNYDENNWKEDIEVMADFLELNRIFCYISFWCFEDFERESFLNILNLLNR